jgi:pimeloyl-ACP methyl ester carboxylesterase
VIAPAQWGVGGEPLTVAVHVADLAEVVRAGATRPALVGASWGAMLALAFAAEHPDKTGPIALVGCGTFDRVARARLQASLAERRGARPYDYDSIDEPGEVAFDECAHRESWDDMMRLQDEGVYPAAFAAIRSPVLMLHGAYDPHPGPMIRDGLARWIPQLEYVEWECCGHEAWRERAVRDEFFATLGDWLVRHFERCS